MKLLAQAVALVGGLLIGGILAQDPSALNSLPPCGQNCIKNMLTKTKGCSETDYACLCSNANFRNGVHDCTIESCPEQNATQVIATGDAFCDSVATSESAASSTAFTVIVSTGTSLTSTLSVPGSKALSTSTSSIIRSPLITPSSAPSKASSVQQSPSGTISLQPSQVTVTETPSSGPLVPQKRSHTGAVVGGIIGGIAGVLLGCVLFWLILGKRQQRETIRAAKIPEEGDYGDIKQDIGGESRESGNLDENNMPIAELLDSSHAHELNGGWVPLEEMDARTLHELHGAHHYCHELGLSSKSGTRSSI